MAKEVGRLMPVGVRVADLRQHYYSSCPYSFGVVEELPECPLGVSCSWQVSTHFLRGSYVCIHILTSTESMQTLISMKQNSCMNCKLLISMLYSLCGFHVRESKAMQRGYHALQPVMFENCDDKHK